MVNAYRIVARGNQLSNGYTLRDKAKATNDEVRNSRNLAEALGGRLSGNLIPTDDEVDVWERLQEAASESMVSEAPKEKKLEVLKQAFITELNSNILVRSKALGGQSDPFFDTLNEKMVERLKSRKAKAEWIFQNRQEELNRFLDSMHKMS